MNYIISQAPNHENPTPRIPSFITGLYLGGLLTTDHILPQTTTRPGWEVGVGKQVWRRPGYSLTAGLDFRQYRYRNEREITLDDARLYRPGTVDTIFRDAFTGQERTVTTDTIAGTLIRQFGHTNRQFELGVPLLLSRDWSRGRSSFSFGLGTRVAYVLSSSGRQINAEGTVSDWSSTDALQLGARTQVIYSHRLGGSALQFRVSAERRFLGADAGAGWVVGTAVGYAFGGGD